jgi:Aminotransferase class I and II
VVGGGLRAGWIAARGPVRERLAMLKLEDDFHTPPLIQHIAARWLAAGSHDRYVESTLPFYRERRDALLEALERHLAGEYRVDPPRGGHHLWVTLNRPLDERALYSEAARHGVSFTPGGAVTAERRTQTSLRLSFPLLDPEALEEGVRRLARAIREVRRRARRTVARRCRSRTRCWWIPVPRSRRGRRRPIPARRAGQRGMEGEAARTPTYRVTPGATFSHSSLSVRRSSRERRSTNRSRTPAR